MGWHGHLKLHYQRHDGRTVALDRHEGPLRVLRRLYPEGPGVCHHVLVHPPGGIVGGDVVALDALLDGGAHALITTPGASRFYRSAGDVAVQQVSACVADGARLEWLPLETIAYNGCLAHNRLRFELQPGAEMIGWDLLALGLPAAGQYFDSGSFLQEIELPKVWLERGRVDASDLRLLDSPLGWAGQRVLGTLWFAAGSALSSARQAGLLESARERIREHQALSGRAGATAPVDKVIVLRVLAPRVEPAMRLLTHVWADWRHAAWCMSPSSPRVWRT